jgi:hypothetical protein
MIDSGIEKDRLGASLDAMNPVYFETHFERFEGWDDWPIEFAIITAYATTGENWPDTKNQAADQQLEVDLHKQGGWVRRLIGYSPTSGHREPGWIVELGLNAACDIGLKYNQDAIYYVSGDTLSVCFCDSRRALVKIGSFRPRVHLAKN